MATITRIYVRLNNRLACSRGQTMGEYALVMAGVAIVAFAAYQYLGSQISTAAHSIGGSV